MRLLSFVVDMPLTPLTHDPIAPQAAQLSPPASSAPALVCKPIPRLSSTRNVAREKLFEVLAASPAADDTLHTLVDEIEAAVFEQNGADEGSKVRSLRAAADSLRA